MSRHILSFLAILICSGAVLAQAGTNSGAHPNQRVPIPGKSLGTYTGLAKDLIPQKVGAFEKWHVEGSTTSKTEKSSPGWRGTMDRVEAFYKTSDGRALGVIVMTFYSIEKAIQDFKKTTKNPTPCRLKETSLKVKGDLIVGERLILECRSGTSIYWNNGSVVFAVATLVGSQKFSPASVNDLLGFEKRFPY